MGSLYDFLFVSLNWKIIKETKCSDVKKKKNFDIGLQNKIL